MYVTYTERFSPSPSLWPRTFINHWRRNWIKPRVTWNTGSKSLPCWYTKTKWGNKVSDEAFKTKAGSDSLKADELAKKKKKTFLQLFFQVFCQTYFRGDEWLLCPVAFSPCFHSLWQLRQCKCTRVIAVTKKKKKSTNHSDNVTVGSVLYLVLYLQVRKVKDF